MHMSRRTLNGMLGSAAFSASMMSAQQVWAEEEDDEINPNLPVFDADGRVVSTADGNTKAEVLLKPVDLGEGASYMVPTIWKEVRGGTGWDDPVGGPQVQEVKLFTSAAAVDDISKLGRIEYVKLKNLPVPEELYAADVVGLKKETRNGMLFYEWDLALSPKECGMQQTLVQGVCFPDKVVLLSACVSNGKFYVLQVTSNEQQWKLGSKAIKALRKTFSVA